LKFSRERQKLGSLFPIIRSFPKSGPAPLVDFPEPLALVPAGFFLPMLPSQKPRQLHGRNNNRFKSGERNQLYLLLCAAR
jgi:hypothetical protein